jgi:hypothetical protein
LNDRNKSQCFFITETTYCSFTSSEKSQRKSSTNLNVFYNRDKLLYVQAVKKPAKRQYE